MTELNMAKWTREEQNAAQCDKTAVLWACLVQGMQSHKRTNPATYQGA